MYEYTSNTERGMIYITDVLDSLASIGITPHAYIQLDPVIITSEFPIDNTYVDKFVCDDFGLLEINGDTIEKVFSRNFYVSDTMSLDTNTGITTSSPLASVQEAVDRIIAGTGERADSTEYIIHVNGNITDTGDNVNYNAMIHIISNYEVHITLQGYNGGGTIDASVANAGFSDQYDKLRVLQMGNGSDVYVTLGNDITLTGGNMPHDGAGVYVQSGIFTMKGNATVRNNETTGNTGGGVYVGNASFIMQSENNQNPTITANKAFTGGAGVSIKPYSGSGGIFSMYAGTISNNEMTSGPSNYGNGGGVLFEGTTFTMSGNATISGNKTTANNAYGGGVYVDAGASFTMETDINGNKPSITGNWTEGAYGDGGGVYIGAYEGAATFNLKAGEITGNETGWDADGAGVYIRDGSSLNLSGNPVINNNTKGDDSSSEASNLWFTNDLTSSPISLSEDITGTTPASIGLTPSTPDAGAMLIMNPLRHGFNENYFTMDDVSLGNPVKVGEDLKMPL